MRKKRKRFYDIIIIFFLKIKKIFMMKNKDIWRDNNNLDKKKGICNEF